MTRKLMILTALAVAALAGTAIAVAGPGPGPDWGGMGQMMRGGAGAGSWTDADRHYIERMIPHHEAAIAMADLALERATSTEIKTLAADIKRTQTAEIAQMRSWYRAWYGTAVPKVSMPGMAAGLDTLKAAADFDRAFIEQMVPHHQSGVMMSAMLGPQMTHAELRTLAASIAKAQQAEIAQMSGWYEDWYGTDVPFAPGGMMDPGFGPGGCRR